MRAKWIQILVFTILALVLGFILGRVTMRPKGHKTHGKKMEKRIMKKKKMMADDMATMEESSSGMQAQVDEIVEGLETMNFLGDTTVAISGGEIMISRSENEMRVEVSLEKSSENGAGEGLIEEEIEITL